MSTTVHAPGTVFANRRSDICRAIAILGCLVVGMTDAIAQVPPSAGQLLNEQQRTLPPAPPAGLAPPTTGTAPAAPAGDASLAAGLAVQLRSVRFSGATELAASENLAALAAPSIGRTLGHGELQQIAEAVTRQLRSRGYVLARAYLPRQDLTDGNLEIALVAGRLQSGADRIAVTGQTRIDPARLKAIAESALPEGRPLRGDDLERAVLLVNDVPGITARSTLERGGEPGTSRLVVDAVEGPLAQGSAWTDNYGNRSTGSARVGAQVVVNDPLRLGDAASLGVSKSSGSTVALLNYSVPLTPSGLRLNAGASYLRYHVDQEAFAPLDLRGTARSGQIGLSYPVLRTRNANLTATAGYEQRRLDDDALGTRVRARQLDNLVVSLAGNRIDSFAGGGLWDGAASLTAGRTDLGGNAVDRIVDSLTSRTDGSFQKVVLRANRLQNLGGAPGSEWTLFAGATGQLASGNLDSSEKFILGGPSGVRAYPVGEAAGDQGVLGTVELRRNIDIGGDRKLQGLAFVDAGRVRLHKSPWPGSFNNADGTNEYSLAGAGVGANLWVGRWTLRAAVARTVGSNPGRSLAGLDADGRGSKWRGWVQAACAF